MDKNTLYQTIRLDFFKKVYAGEIRPHQPLPAERKQAEELSVSRGTIRKARQILAEEGYIANTQGSAAVYTPLAKGPSGKPEIVAVVVPVHNPFFMSYYRAFEKEAEEADVLVMIKQLDSRNAGQLKKVLFSFFIKGIRDVVFWPYDTVLDYPYIERLSGLGMNFIFFDNVHDFPCCDYISVDNRDGISLLYKSLQDKGCGRIAYMGWDNPHLTSNSEREAAFRQEKSEGDRVIRIPWNQEDLSFDLLESVLNLPDLRGERKIDGFLCGNGLIGVVLKRYLNNNGFSGIPLVSIDNFEESEDLGFTVYEQPFEMMGRKTFHLLEKRHRDEKGNSPEKLYIKGRLIER